MIDPDTALSGRVTRLAELVAELRNPQCLCTGSSSFCVCRGVLQSVAVHDSESSHLELH